MQERNNNYTMLRDGRARVDGRDYILVPATNNDGSTPQISFQRSPLMKFDDPKISRVAVFQYTPLPKTEKRIRLLKLSSGTSDGSEISCELFEADYDNDYHIPTKVPKEGKKKTQVEKQSQPEDEFIERSDLESEAEESPDDIKLRKKRQEKRKEEQDEKRKKEKEMTEKQKEEETEKNNKEVLGKLEKVKENEIEYEALSWCWGSEAEDYVVMIQQDNKTFKKRVKRELALALKYLRHPGKQRILWIDAICIDQSNPDERNHQVQMMSRVYTRAKQVCIWLGEDTSESHMAIEFIRKEIMELKNFDEICSHRRYSDKWQALMMLMQREWFSRRWVVQEISLASRAVVCCGPDTIPWRDFAVAVELFVEVETATHRLSEVMLKDEKFRHVPGWFEYVSELGASLLVQATGKVFRSHRTPMHDALEQDPEDAMDEKKLKEFEERKEKQEKAEREELEKRILEVQTVDPLERRSLLSLEYLVSTMFIFKAAEPRDAVYAMLAIAKDAAPFATPASGKPDQAHQIMSLFESFLEEKPFEVDYSRPYADVCRDFVNFSVRRTCKSDPVQALDILCRPWALDNAPGISIRLKPKASSERRKRFLPKRKEWKTRESENGKSTWKEDDRDIEKYYSDAEQIWKPKSSDRTRWKMICAKYFPLASPRGEEPPLGECRAPAPQENTEKPDIDLPQWVARASQAPFSLFQHPGMHILKTGRANPDPLVGPPEEGHRNYNAAQSQQLELSTFKLRKRPTLKHYSLFVEGFELEKIVEIMDASQSGNIPKSWLELAGWKEPYDTDPPNDFWRTLVADRGRDNRNPPYYYARAFKESVHKGGISSGSVDTGALIKNERNSIVAEFCRRVHAVIWNRRMFKTDKGRLGLASKHITEGDLVCILYGCTVPVVLKKVEKKEGDREAEEREDVVEALRSYVRKAEKNRERKATSRYRKEQRKRQLKEQLEEQQLKKQSQEQSNEQSEEPSEEQSEKQPMVDVWQEMMDARKEFNMKVKEKKGHEAAVPGTPSESASDVGSEGSGDAKTSQEKEIPRTTKRKAPKSLEEEDLGCHYYFKGECYLHGMMDGEAVREKFYLRTSDRLLELR